MDKLIVPVQVEPKTFLYWLASGAITTIQTGEENTYGVNEFGHVCFAKL